MSEDILNQESEVPTSEETFVEQDNSRKLGFNLFDAMLGISVIFVVLAILVLVMELREFGNFPFQFPWKTSEILNG